MPKKKATEPSFEEALAELEALVDELEQGDLT
ncbi:MAG: exodeoxyribonuclease VII small subunit, partial [Candidatus Sedimenticola endophacoides]